GRNPARFGGNLRKDRVRTLPIFDIRREHFHAALCRQPHRQLGREPDLAAARESATVKEDRKPHAATLIRSPSVVTLESVPLLAVTGQRQSSIHQSREIHFVAHNLSRRHPIALPQEIPAPYFGWVYLQLLRRPVHVHLHGENRLRRAEAAKCAVR